MIKEKERQMNDAVKVLDFETAALLRDEINALKLSPSKNGSVEPHNKGRAVRNKRKSKNA